MAAPHVLFAGRTTLDALYWLDGLPAEDTKVFARGFRMAPGGPACNAAITHALLGGRATLLSAVGSGAAAEVVREELARPGVRLVDLADGTSYETPLTTVLVNATAATRTIINPPQAELDLPELEGGWRPEWGDLPVAALTDGFHLEETWPLLASMREAGTTLILDGGSWKPGTDVLTPLLTVAICGERFAVPGRTADAETTLEWFAEQRVRHVAVTRGARSIVGLDGGRRFEIAVEPVKAVDTSGAGDVLHGAFCFHFAMTGDFEASLRRAAALASLSCTGLGITHWAAP
ncbi:MAG TPA: PfkB family carbohydrate kinase [Terracidiphilus sp.]|jgi:sugar/nucleoside kinase (ribokinase family)